MQKEDNYIVETLNSCFGDLKLPENNNLQQINYADIGLTIANLVLKRLEEKVYWRKKFKSQSDEIIDDEERW